MRPEGCRTGLPPTFSPHPPRPGASPEEGENGRQPLQAEEISTPMQFHVLTLGRCPGGTGSLLGACSYRVPIPPHRAEAWPGSPLRSGNTGTPHSQERRHRGACCPPPRVFATLPGIITPDRARRSLGCRLYKPDSFST